MATTITLQAKNFCASGTHFTLEATGDVNYSTDYSIYDFTAPLTDEEKSAFLKALVWFARITRTNAQVKTALLNGVQVSL